MYLLWSPRMQGWLSRSGNYVSTQDHAAKYSRDDALALAVRHMNTGWAEYGLLPVCETDLDLMKELAK